MKRLCVRSQKGTALVAAIFLIVVVAALGVFATRIGLGQDYAARLQLLQLRAEVAASTGLDWASNRARANNCGNASFMVDSFSLVVTCTAIPAPPATPVAFELTASASNGVYGQPDFVQRQSSRTVSGIGPGTW